MTRRGFVFGSALLASPTAAAEDPQLRLSLTLPRTAFRLGESIQLAWTLENISTHPLTIVAFHTAAGGPQYDELHISLSRNNTATQQISLVGPRAASQRVWKSLKPGENLRQEFDLTRAMELSGHKPESGDYHLSAGYSQQSPTDDDGQPVWRGTASAELSFRVNP